MKLKVTKYLYLSRKTKFGKILSRISANKGIIKKNEICLKLEIDLDSELFEEIVPVVTLDVPKDYKHTGAKINLRLG